MRNGARVLFYVHDDAYFLSHRLDLARRLQEEGHEVVVATPDGGKCHEIRAAGFRHVAVAVGKTRNPIRMLRSVFLLARLYRQVRPDVVFHVSMRPILFGGIAARLAGCHRVVNLVTGLGYVFTSGSPMLRWAVERVYRFALQGRVIFQNPDDRALFIEREICRAAQAELIRGSGVDTRRFTPSPEPDGVPVVYFAARLLWDKGLGELVEAGRLLRARGIEHRIVAAGKLDPANPAAVPDDQVRAWVEAGEIEWVGVESDMAESWRRCAIACLPSYREGLPLCLIEAASCGRPLVTTDVPGCRETVEAGVTGLLVPVRDAVALARALADLLGDRARRAAMGAAGRGRVERLFANDIVLTQTAVVVRSLLSANYEAELRRVGPSSRSQKR